MVAEHHEPIQLYHRGLRKDVSLVNSFEAITNAKRGDYLEMDVFLLKDGSLVVTHHSDLGLSMEQVEDLDLATFQGMDNPGRGAAADLRSGFKMPLYEEILFQACDRGVNLYIELKASSEEKIKNLVGALVNRMVDLQSEGAFGKEKKFIGDNLTFFSLSVEGVASMIEELKKRGLKNRTILGWPSSEKYAKEMEISKSAIDYARRLDKGDWFERGIAIAKAIGSNGILIYADVLIKNPRYVALAHSLGLQVLAGGLVEDEAEREKLKEMGVDIYASELLI